MHKMIPFQRIKNMLYTALLLLLVCFCLLYQLAVYRERNSRLKRIEEELFLLRQEKSSLLEKVARLEEEKKQFSKAEQQLKDAFKAVSADVLKDSQRSFFDVAQATFEKYLFGMQQKQSAVQDIVKPLQESLQKVDGAIHELEKTRLTAYVGISEQLKMLSKTNIYLETQTSKLVKALHTPAVRGKWGEMQLKRVVEMAGMVSYCDFVQQHTQPENGRLRPDLVVKLPNSRSIVVDAKTPLQAYLEAIDAPDEETKVLKLKEHAKQLKYHLSELGAKSYWEHFQPAPEFVVLFLPAESFFSAALEHDPALIEYGVEKRVLLATPTTLIALLQSVAYGWREDKVAEHAQAISLLGKDLHERMRTMCEHFIKLKKSLSSSVEAYNKAVASFETRVMPAARKFHEMKVTTAQALPQLELIAVNNPLRDCLIGDEEPCGS
jgi:DNA recombination protein RmuC